MKERGIIFNGDMVRAILDGRKTQTRRPVKPQPRIVLNIGVISGVVKILTNLLFRRKDQWIKCPYGKPGDRLWVKETFRRPEYNEYDEWVDVEYKAAHPIPEELKWRPSIHMPREASRILLEIVSVRVERVQDISEAGAIAEGIERNLDEGVMYYGPLDKGHADARVAFSWLWDSIYAAKGNGWDTNPWVWVVEFKLIGEET